MGRRGLLGNLGIVIRMILRIVVIVVLAALLYYGAKKAYHVGYSVFTIGAMSQEPGEDVVVTISEGMSDYSVGKLLQSKGLIEDKVVYVIQAKVYEFDPVPGSYLLNTSQTLTEMMDIMTAETEESEDRKTE